MSTAKFHYNRLTSDRAIQTIKIETQCTNCNNQRHSLMCKLLLLTLATSIGLNVVMHVYCIFILFFSLLPSTVD